MGNFWKQAQTQQVLCCEYFFKMEHQVLVFPYQLLLRITISYLSHLQVLLLSKQSWICPKILSWGNTRDQRPSQCQQLQAAPLFWPPRAGKEYIPVPKTTQKIFLTKNITEASYDTKAEALNALFKQRQARAQGHTRHVQRTANQGGGRLFSPPHSPSLFFFLFFLVFIKKTICFKQIALGLTVYNYI